MLPNAFSRFFESVAKVRTILAPHWRRLIVLSLMFVGLAVFCLAEVGVAKLIVSGGYLTLAGMFVGIIVISITAAHPFWGFAIWFFCSSYLSLFNRMLPRKFNFDLTMLGFIALVLVFRTLFKRKPLGKLAIEEVFLILFFIYEYIIRHTFSSADVVVELRYYLLSPFALYFISKNIILNKKHIYWLMILTIVTGFSWALMGIYEQISQKMWLAAILGGDRGLYAGIRSAGPAGFYYLYGNMLILTILLCMHTLGWMRNAYSKLLMLGVGLVSAVGLYYGYSRAPYVAFAVSLLIMVILARRTRAVYAVSVAMLVITVFVVVPIISSSHVLTKRFTTQVDTRIATNATSMNMFKANYLFGVGTGNYGANIPKHVVRGHLVNVNPISGLRNSYSTPHSEYYLKLCEGGIVGFLLYFGTYILFIFRAMKIRAKTSIKDVGGSDFASVVVAITVALLITMVTDMFSIHQFMYAIIFTAFAMVNRSQSLALDQNEIESA